MRKHFVIRVVVPLAVLVALVLLYRQFHHPDSFMASTSEKEMMAHAKKIGLHTAEETVMAPPV